MVRLVSDTETLKLFRSYAEIYFPCCLLGDVLSFTNAVLKKAGCKELKSNTECWKLITQGGKTMQQLKQEAAQKAKDLRVNPRSIKEWKALGDGDLSKIRRLGANAPGEKEDVQDAASKSAKKASARKRLSADSDESGDASLDEDEEVSSSSEDKDVCEKPSSAMDLKVLT
jgi:hypothetical protein